MAEELNPYASPQSEIPQLLPPDSPGSGIPLSRRRAAAFRSAGTAGYVAIALIALCMLLEVGVLVLRVLDVWAIQQIIAGVELSPQDIAFEQSALLLVEGSRMVLVFVAAVPFIMWLYRSHANLPALAAKPLQQSPGWAIGGWFIPIGNLFIPYQVVQETFRGSNPDGRLDSMIVTLGSRSKMVVAWWTLWLLCGFAATGGSNAIQLQSGGQPNLNVLWVAALVLLFASPLRFGAGVCIIQVIRTIIRHQDERLALLAQRSPPPQKVLAWPPATASRTGL